MLITVLSIAGAVVYFSISTVLRIKNNPTEEIVPEFTIEASGGDVVGLPGVPQFPSSTFMFESHIREDSVQRFLGSGQSAYVLPDGAEWTDAIEFYLQNLTAPNWTHVLSVEMTDDTKRFGEYWVYSGEVTYGLRIYTKVDDVWYEKLTDTEARSGLSNEVAEEIEMEILLSLGSSSELPETFVWALRYPNSWSVEIRKSTLLEIEEAVFTNSETGGKLAITPIDFVSMQDLDALGRRYIEQANVARDSDAQLTVSTSEAVTIAGQNGVKFALTNGEGSAYLCLLANPKNRVVYAIVTYDDELAMFNFVLGNIVSR